MTEVTSWAELILTAAAELDRARRRDAPPPPSKVRETEEAGESSSDPTLVEAHKQARDCILYGIERAERDWHDPAAQRAAAQMADDLLLTFDHYLPAGLIATQEKALVEAREALLVADEHLTGIENYGGEPAVRARRGRSAIEASLKGDHS